MIKVYGIDQSGLIVIDLEATPNPARDRILWIDLLAPTHEEERTVEQLLGLQVPTREEMTEIEDSARFYRDGDAVVVTAAIIDGAAEDRPRAMPLTFVLTRSHLVTVRYSDPHSLRMFAAKCQKRPASFREARSIFVSLLETIVERAADVAEMVGADLMTVSTRLFFEDKSHKKSKAATNDLALQALIRRLGRKNMTISVLRESFHGLGRLMTFVRTAADDWFTPELLTRLKQVERDVRSISDFERQLESEIVYLHDATLGLINLEQNRIIKVFSIAAVLFLPPTVVGTIYGMNFKYMPELDWLYGYPMALGLMIVSALLPYFWFKFRGWL